MINSVSRHWALIVMVLIPLAFSPASIGRAEVPTRGTQGFDAVAVETVFSEVAGGLDEFGRAPLFRLTFQWTAGVGPEDLPTPFVAYVESGSFEYRDGSGAYTDLDVGAVVEVDVGVDFAIRNTGRSIATLLVVSLPGSCLRYADFACGPHFLPYDFLCDGPCRPDITNTLLFIDQDLVNRFLPVTYSLHKVSPGVNEEVDPFDFGEEAGLIRLLVRVDVGAVESSTGDTYTAGDAFEPTSDELLVATDSEGTELLVLSIAQTP